MKGRKLKTYAGTFLTEKQYAYCLKKGEHNLSLGIRDAIQFSMDTEKELNAKKTRKRTKKV